MRFTKMSEKKSMESKKSMIGMKWIVVLLALFLVAGVFVGAVGAGEVTASFTAIPGSGADSLKVTFDASASSTTAEDKSLTYSWDFGDNSTPSPDVKPTYTYGAAGTYSVKLTVRDSENGSNDTTNSVTVNQPPAEKTEISSFEVSVSKAPATGDVEPTISLSGANASALEKGTVSWTPSLTSGKFVADTEYKASFDVTIKDTTANKFASTVNASNTPTGAKSAPAVSGRTDSKVTVEITFNKTAADTTEISSFGVSVSKAPATGDGEPIISLSEASASALEKGTVSWTPSLTSGKFVADTEYKASFDVTIKDTTANKFASTVNVSNTPTGAKSAPTVSGRTDSKVTVEITFNKTAASTPTEINSITVTGITAPALGDKLRAPTNPAVSATNPAGNQEKLHVTGFKWKKEGATTDPSIGDDVTEGTYVAEFTITAYEGVTIQNGATVKAGNKNGTYASETKKATISYVLGKTSVNSIEVSVSAAPAGGNAAPTISLTDNTNLTKGNDLKWYEGTSNTPLTDITSLKYGTDYRAEFTVLITNDDTHKFANTVSVSGPDCVLSTSSVTKDSVTPDSRVKVILKFKTAASDEISSVDLSLTAPAVDGTPATASSVTKSPSTAKYGVTTLEWFDGQTKLQSGAKFAAGKAYTAHIVLTATGSAYFKSGLTKYDVRVNSDILGAAPTIPSGGATLTFDFTFPTITGEITSVSLTMDEPEVGETASTATSLVTKDPTTAKYSVTSLKWYDGSSELGSNATFAAGKAYTAKITLTANTGIKFKSDIAKSNIKVNNTAITANPTIPSGGATLTLEFTFPETTSEISSVSLTMSTPTIDSNISTSTSLVTKDPSTAKYTVTSLDWYDGSTKLTTSETFAVGKEYTAEIKLTANTNSVFKSGLTTSDVKVNGNATVAAPTYTSNNTIITFKYKFPALSSEISSVSLTMSTPTIDSNISTSTSLVTKDPSTAKYSVTSLDWYDGSTKLTTSDKFAVGKEYTAEIKLTAETGSVFKSSFAKADAKVNGKSALENPTVSSDKKTLTFKYKFPALTREISSVSVTMTAPTVGATVSTAASSVTPESSANYTVDSLKWYIGSNEVTSGKFEAGNKYTAKITLKANTGYLFSDSITKSSAKVNSASADSNPEAVSNKEKLVVYYTFPELTAAPVISKFSASPTSPVIKLNEDQVSVTFTYEFSGTYSSATLYYGDGYSDVLASAGDTQQNGTKQHKYTSTGSKTATLTVRGTDGKDVTKTLTLNITKEELTASFSASPSSGEAPLAVNFTGTTAGNVTSWTWDFNDGSPQETGKTVSHIFQKEGNYNVTLKVVSGGQTSSKSQKITVTASKDGKESKSDEDDGEAFTLPFPFNIFVDFVNLFKSLFDFEEHPLFPDSAEE